MEKNLVNNVNTAYNRNCVHQVHIMWHGVQERTKHITMRR